MQSGDKKDRSDEISDETGADGTGNEQAISFDVLELSNSEEEYDGEAFSDDFFPPSERGDAENLPELVPEEVRLAAAIGRPMHRSSRSELILLLCSILLSVLLMVGAALSWFVKEAADISKPAGLSIGKVSYELLNVKNLFYTLFDYGDENGDEFDEDFGYHAATAVSFVSVEGVQLDDLTLSGSGVYECSYSIAQNSKAKIEVGLSPVSSTDILTFSSDSEDTIPVSAFGTMKGIGDVGSEATVTVTVTARQIPDGYDPLPTGSTDRVGVFTILMHITIIDGDVTDYSYLPDMQNLLKNPVTLENSSTVDSKLRVRVDWEFENYPGELSTKQKVSVAELLSQYGTEHTENLTLPNDQSPVSLTIDGTNFSYVAPQAGAFTMSDTTGRLWTVETLALTQTELDNVISALQGNRTTTLGLGTIDKAYIYVCYNRGGTVATDGENYGIAVPSAEAADAAAAGDVAPFSSGTDDPNIYSPISAITTRQNYSGISTRKILVFSVTAQARQADFYSVGTEDGSEAGWFDVYCEIVAHTDCIKPETEAPQTTTP